MVRGYVGEVEVRVVGDCEIKMMPWVLLQLNRCANRNSILNVVEYSAKIDTVSAD